MFNFKKTIDTIIADIVQKVEDLKTLADKHHFNSLAHKAESEFRAKLSEEEAKLRDKAHQIADKLTSLIS
jgi:hypothetical protein